MFRRRSAGHQTHAEDGGKCTSGSKLRDLFRSGTHSLDDALADMEQAALLLLKAAELERRGAMKLWLWTKQGSNTALKSVTGGLKELQEMQTEEKIRHAHEMIKSVEGLRQMEEVDTNLQKAEEKSQPCPYQSGIPEKLQKIYQMFDLKEREQKMEKEIKQMQTGGGLFRSRSTDAVQQRGHMGQLLNVIRKREEAEDRVEKLRTEAEVVKMYRFRNAMKKLSESYCDGVQRLSTIFSCHRELVELVPAVVTEDAKYVKYEGARIVQEKVEAVKMYLTSSPSCSAEPNSTLLEQSKNRRRTAPLRMGSGWERSSKLSIRSPPPPYSPCSKDHLSGYGMDSRTNYPNVRTPPNDKNANEKFASRRAPTYVPSQDELVTASIKGQMDLVGEMGVTPFRYPGTHL